MKNMFYLHLQNLFNKIFINSLVTNFVKSNNDSAFNHVKFNLNNILFAF